MIKYDFTTDKLSYSDWEQIRIWLTENNIQWYSCGNKGIGFDSEKDYLLFALRWA